MSNETPEPQPNANGGEKQRLRNVLTNLLATVTSLAGISSIAVILSMLFVYIYAGTSKDTPPQENLWVNFGSGRAPSV